MYTLAEFLETDLSLIIYDDGRELFRSTASNLEPLVAFLKMGINTRGAVTVFDRYVGRAAALLISTLRAKKVYTGVISEGGAVVFEETGLEFEAGERAKYLMGVASADMCRWEKMAVGKTPQELLAALNGVREK